MGYVYALKVMGAVWTVGHAANSWKEEGNRRARGGMRAEVLQWRPISGGIVGNVKLPRPRNDS